MPRTPAAAAAAAASGPPGPGRPHAKRLQNFKFEGKKAPSIDPKILAASTIQRYWRKRFKNNLTYQLIENSLGDARL